MDRNSYRYVFTFIGSLNVIFGEGRHPEWLWFETDVLFSIYICCILCELTLSLKKTDLLSFSLYCRWVWCVMRCSCESLLTAYAVSVTSTLSLFVCSVNHHTDRPEVALTSLAWWGAAVRREHTLTALWDREAGRRELWVRARGGYRPSGQRSQEAARRRQNGNSHHGNTSGPGKSWQLVTK